MKIYLFLIFLTTLLFSKEADIDELLSQYRAASELYFETKNEEAGHIIVFSRADLDKMQAYTLNDVLKTLRMFTLKTTNFGMSSLVKTPYSEQSMSSVKIFINSYELTSVTSGTSMAQFGKMGLNHIDHIEVYQASNSITFSGEPGNMIIKLYTKDSSRERAFVSQLSLDSEGGSRAQIIEADTFNGYSCLANIDIGKNEYKKYKNNQSTLSRDGYRGQFYFNLSKKEDFMLEAGSSSEKYDLFSGIGSSIEDGEVDVKYHYIQFTKYLDTSLKFIFSSTYETLEIENSDTTGISLFDETIANDFIMRAGSYTNSAILEKRHKYKNNNLLFGAQVKFKRFFLDELKSNSTEKPIILGPKKLDIYMAYFEDIYSINKDHKITLGLKFDHYDSHFGTSSTQETFRLGYIGRLSENFSLKSFVQKGYIYPIFAQTTFSPIYNPNPYLKSSKTAIAKVELEYKKESVTITAGAGGSKSKNGIIYDASEKIYINNDKNSDYKHFFINSSYKFNADNKIIFEYFKAYKDNFYFSSDEGVLLQIYNRVNKFDIYNELVYRSSYIGVDGVHIDAGYDYTAGIIYHYSKKLDLKIKGENIFDKAIQNSISGIKVPALEKRAIFTMEYIF
ncbi:TonB-dependent receptor domain-containing protein [Sulfurimonas xiamenensis]|uniref:TonB-dependent receptor n=1 Tax=Sulfurimonas xiamenensis TaxID=2590021 RepID=A0AAJ4A4L5_9BACT|nr:TonB-dependent receptor [Sulfurimonas xiamenensis]QFR43782.1 TonB-dependent receptor [Sulfurimonas xiamenensis]